MDVIDLVSDDDSIQADVAVADNDVLEYRVSVPGKPVAMPRCRFFKRVVVNKADKLIADFRDYVRKDLENQGVGNFPVLGESAVVLEIWFCMRLPNEAFINGDRQRLRGDLNRDDQCHYCAKKPDVDNYLKFTMDALKGVAFTDDKCVVGVTAYKCLDTTPPYNGKTMFVLKAAGINSMMKPIPNWNI
jgi:Holliday junction resolvase RusA-like endonuclease